jgi:hypothetical protein
MSFTLYRRLTGFMALFILFCSSTVYGQAKIQVDNNLSVSVGGGMRTTFRSTETLPESGDYVNKFSLESARFYFNADILKDFKLEINTEYDGPTNTVRILDAVAKYAPNENINVWMGRHLPPSDRANLDGPFFLSIFDYPGLVSRYPGIFAGRDNGLSVSGQVKGGKFKYAVGAYDGSPTVLGTTDNNLYAGRVVFNFLDPEPGYYNSSSYYGEKDILALGFAAQRQADVIAQGGQAKGFTGYNADLLFEKKLPDEGVVTLEGAYYKYNVEHTSGHGSAFLVQAAYLFPTMLGIGKIQPIARYQDFRDESILDVGANYVIKGHSARLSFMYSPSYSGGAWNNRKNQFTGGAQFQF